MKTLIITTLTGKHAYDGPKTAPAELTGCTCRSSITFRYYAPNAQQLMLHGEFLAEPLAMVKDNSGIWTVTVPPVEPDIYPYFFKEDNVQLADPNNTYIFAQKNFKRTLLTILLMRH